ncbi:unnamed protein product [Staurois parvus]|uniref:Uncharacterized protein n=1 Tax=Staurois parvus TaxID=386267 RepID=A0ABN9G9G3_9NEOB|nr:unnamed protein product [Staurois parvus]
MYINAGREQCRSGLSFINGAHILQPVRARHHDPVPAVSGGHSGTLIAVWDLCVRSRSCDH